MQELINKFSSDYKVIIVGDATMSSYEITNSGGSIEHWNEEPGIVWLKKLSDHFKKDCMVEPSSR